MKQAKDENKVEAKVKATAKYSSMAPGAIGKGRGRGLKSMLSLGASRINIPYSPSTDQVMQHNQIVETGAVAKGRGQGLRSMSNAQGAQGKSEGLRSMCSFEESEDEERSFHQNAHYVSQNLQRV